MFPSPYTTGGSSTARMAWTTSMPSPCFVLPHRHRTSTSSTRPPSMRSSNNRRVGGILLGDTNNNNNDSRRLFSSWQENNHDETATSDTETMSALFQDRRAFLVSLGTTGMVMNHHDAVAFAATTTAAADDDDASMEDPLDAFGKALSEKGGGAWPASNVSPLPLPSRRPDIRSDSSSSANSSDDDDDDSSVSSTEQNGLEQTLQRMQKKRSINPLTHG